VDTNKNIKQIVKPTSRRSAHEHSEKYRSHPPAYSHYLIAAVARYCPQPLVYSHLKSLPKSTIKEDRALVQQVMSPLLPICDLTLHPHHCLHKGTKRSKRSLHQHINNTIITTNGTIGTTTITCTYGCPLVNKGSDYPGRRSPKRHGMVIICQACNQVR
jgi:hypothetical protein